MVYHLGVIAIVATAFLAAHAQSYGAQDYSPPQAPVVPVFVPYPAPPPPVLPELPASHELVRLLLTVNGSSSSLDITTTTATIVIITNHRAANPIVILQAIPIRTAMNIMEVRNKK